MFFLLSVKRGAVSVNPKNPYQKILRFFFTKGGGLTQSKRGLSEKLRFFGIIYQKKGGLKKTGIFLTIFRRKGGLAQSKRVLSDFLA